MTCVFEFRCPPCQRVALAGTFNNWSTNALPMEKHGDHWEAALELAPGNYEYCYFVFQDDVRPPRGSVVNAGQLHVPQRTAGRLTIKSAEFTSHSSAPPGSGRYLH